MPTGIPLLYEFDDQLRATGRRYLGDAAAVEKAMQTVASQGKAQRVG